MNDQPEQPPEQPSEKVLSAQLPVFREALETLYIPGNPSGRNHFREEWPAAAERIFDKQLTGYDLNGVTDKERRAELEEKAEQEQTRLLTLLLDVEGQSVEGGMLNQDFVRGAMEKLGHEISLCVYEEELVEKFLGAAPAKVVESGFNLGEKKNIVQVDFKEPKAVSYQDLVGQEADSRPSYRALFNALAAQDTETAEAG